MTSLINVGPIIPTILAIVMLITLWGDAFLLFSMISYGRGFFRNICVTFMMLIEYVFIQIMIYKLQHWNPNFIYDERNEVFMGFSVPLFVLVAIIFFIITTIMIIENFNWNHRHISRLSVKESFDKLPFGVCYYMESGMPILVNPVADKVSQTISGGIVRDGADFYKSLKASGSYIEMPDGKYVSYSRKEIQIDGETYYSIAINDVTEEIEKSNELSKENEKLTEMNTHLRNLNKTLDEVAIQSEILEAKVRIHDSLGQILLMTKLFLKRNNGSDLEDDEKYGYENAEILKEKWKEAIRFLDSPEEMKDNQLERIFSVAEDVGIKIDIDGELPKENSQIDLLAKAIHECMTNAIRHAGADELYVTLSYGLGIRIEISNNGKQPTSQPSESGGLVNLRKQIEEQGGSMDIEWENGYKLIICS